eukprot:1510698-Rhodomonas_salina.1
MMIWRSSRLEVFTLTWCFVGTGLLQPGDDQDVQLQQWVDDPELRVRCDRSDLSHDGDQQRRERLQERYQPSPALAKRLLPTMAG